jgi:raffinose/stachyose/melibiose transport system permease protein
MDLAINARVESPDRFALRRRAGKYLLYAFLTIFAVLQLFPLLWLFDYSLVKSGQLFGPQILTWPHPFQWQNYARAWINGNIPTYFMNSVIIVGGSVIGATILSFCVAYACTRMTWKLRIVVYNIVLLGMIIPIHTTLLPNFVWFKVFGLLNTRIGVIIPYIAFNLSFNTLMFSGMMKNLPRSVEESAYLDGAGMGSLLARIVAPMTGPAFATVSIMTFLNGWNEFIMANTFLASERLRTLPFAVIRFEGEYSSDYAVQFACMALVAIPPIILYFVFNRWIMAGVTAGAVKS